MSSTSALLNFSASAGERDGGLADATPRVESARALDRVASPELVEGVDPDVVVSPPAAPTEAWTPNAPRAFLSPKATARLDASARRHAAPGDTIAREPEPSAKDVRRTREGDAAAGGARLPVPLTGEARVLREPRPRRIRARCPRQPDCSHYPNSFTRSARARAPHTPEPPARLRSVRNRFSRLSRSRSRSAAYTR